MIAVTISKTRGKNRLPVVLPLLLKSSELANIPWFFRTSGDQKFAYMKFREIVWVETSAKKKKI